MAPDPRFPYAVDKAAQERVVLEVSPEATRVRPAIVYGPGARSYLTELLRRSPFVPAVDGVKPRLQFVHVEDLADAVGGEVLHWAIEGVRQDIPIWENKIHRPDPVLCETDQALAAFRRTLADSSLVRLRPAAPSGKKAGI